MRNLRQKQKVTIGAGGARQMHVRGSCVWKMACCDHTRVKCEVTVTWARWTGGRLDPKSPPKAPKRPPRSPKRTSIHLEKTSGGRLDPKSPPKGPTQPSNAHQKDLDPPRKDLGGIARTSGCLIDPQLGRHGRADARAPTDGARVRSLRLENARDFL